MKYLVMYNSNDGYEGGYDSFDTEEEALEYINNPFYSIGSVRVFKGEELQVLKSSDGKKIISKPEGE